MSTTVTTKGQVTIPKRVRDRLGLAPGSKVDFALDENGRVVLSKVDGDRPVSRFEKIRGILKSDMSTDELMAWLRD